MIASSMTTTPDSNPIETQLEFPQFEHRGFFMLAHSVFDDPVLRSLPGDSFRLFLWMSSRAWKYRDSTGLIRASISYAAHGAGLSEACISRSLKVLVDAELIAVKERNFKLGNLWSVSVRAALRKVPAAKVPQNEWATPSKGGTTSLTRRGKVPPGERQLIRFKKTQERKEAEALEGDGYGVKAQAFSKAFESEQARADAVQRYANAVPALKSLGPAARAFAVTRWWEENHQILDRLGSDH